MSLKLSFGTPVIVAQGPTYRDAGWGPYQFPKLANLGNGTIAIRYHIVQDESEAYGQEGGWATSKDGGAHWQAVEPANLPAVKARFGTKLASGKYLRSIQPAPYKISPELHKELSQKMNYYQRSLGVEEIPDGLFEKDQWLFAISEPDSLKERLFYSNLDFPGMTLSLTTGAIVRPFPFGPMYTAPDGSLWIAHYWRGRNPENLGHTSYYACYYFQSLDEGTSFQLKSWIQYLPDTYAFPRAFTTEGFCEPDLCFMPDGSMITLMRTGGDTPCYLARSTDGGQHWETPVLFDRCGVLPQLLHLPCGVTLASYGRPGLFVRASADPSGMQWDDPYTLMPYDPARATQVSCCYTSLLPLDDRTALLAYTDFAVADAAGIPRKSIMVRTIHVD